MYAGEPSIQSNECTCQFATHIWQSVLMANESELCPRKNRNIQTTCLHEMGMGMTFNSTESIACWRSWRCQSIVYVPIRVEALCATSVWTILAMHHSVSSVAPCHPLSSLKPLLPSLSTENISVQRDSPFCRFEAELLERLEGPAENNLKKRGICAKRKLNRQGLLLRGAAHVVGSGVHSIISCATCLVFRVMSIFIENCD